MQIKVFSFQGVRKGLPLGTVKGMLPIINALSSYSTKIIDYYLGYSQGYTGDLHLKKLNRLYQLLVRLTYFVNRLIIHLPVYKMRYFSEKLFDLFAAFKINEPTIVISSAYLSKTLKRNKDLGGINIFIAYNPDDFEIYTILKKEKKDNNLSFEDSYTYERRVKFVSESILLYDKIVTATISEYESYTKRIPLNKVSFIESHIIPKPDTFPNIDYPKNKELTFCFVAHPFWLKGLVYLLEAWSKINHSEIKLVIVGTIDGDLQKIINKRFSKLNNVKYVGWVNDLNQLYRTSHICIVPSLLDAGPATVAEAMYCGLPVIVTNGCGARTLVDEGVNGFIVPAGNSEMIAEKIKWFIDNKHTIDLMSKEASITISKVAVSNQDNIVAEHICDTIKELQEK